MTMTMDGNVFFLLMQYITNVDIIIHHYIDMIWNDMHFKSNKQNGLEAVAYI